MSLSLRAIETNFNERCLEINALSNSDAIPQADRIFKYQKAGYGFKADKREISSKIQNWKASHLKQPSFDESEELEVGEKTQLRKTCEKIFAVLPDIFMGVGASVALAAAAVFVLTPPSLVLIGIMASGAALMGVGATFTVYNDNLVLNDPDFKDFVVNEVKIDWNPNSKDLLDPQLHAIYRLYVSAVIRLPRN